MNSPPYVRTASRTGAAKIRGWLQDELETTPVSVQSIGSPHDAHGLERETPVPGAGPPAYLKRPIVRIAVICYHTSPLVQPGGRDAGGMNVYVRETAAELGKLGYA